MALPHMGIELRSERREPTYARIEAKGATTFVKLTNKNGHEQTIKP
jgi:hypothetical protein